PDDTYSARKEMNDEDMLAVLEKCYSVIHGRKTSTTSSMGSNTPSDNHPIGHSNDLLQKYMKRHIFESIRNCLTRLDHNLYDIIWPTVKKLPDDRNCRLSLNQDFPVGIVAPDFYVYKVFRNLLEPIIKAYNNIAQHTELREHPESRQVARSENGIEDNTETNDIEFDLDPNKKWVISGCIECTRNLDDHELPKSLSVNQLENIERILTSIFMSEDVGRALFPRANEDEIGGTGTYYTMNEILEEPSDIRNMLDSRNLLIPLWNIPDSERLHGKYWPYGRGVFVSNAGNLAAWINVLDHLRIVTCTPETKPGNVGQIYSRLSRLMDVIDSKLYFKKDFNFGFLSARPTVLGNTLQFNFIVKLTQLVKEPENLQHLCSVRGLNYHKVHVSDLVRLSNQQTVGITEIQSFDDFTTAVANIIQLEKDLEMSNTIHIAAMFVNIFKRKKTPLIT
ncbi:hypothetical protein WA026_017162, partial [Henosepilachna vigintioctopunctata]